ncbi:MAG: hypothetical protein OER95_16405 [Acidimicrobiia bacterium]|nr:hypothetical protein [Acidimicrobiia bacterium]
MRQGVASLFMGLSLLLASAGWAGLTLSATVLDPDSARLQAHRALDHPAVTAALADRIGDGMARILPEDEPMSRQELAAAARTALDDTAAQAALRTGMADAYRLGLAGQQVEGSFAHFDSNEAARLALIEQRPTLQGRILVNPLVPVTLPASGLTWLSGLKLMVDRFAILSVAAGLIGFASAFVVAQDASATMRRAAWWILGAAAFWSLAAALFSVGAVQLAPSSYAMLTSAVETYLASMRMPAVLMITLGLGMLAASVVVPALNRRRGAFLLANDERSRQRVSGRTMVLPMADPATKPDGVGRRTGSRFSAEWLEGHGYLDDARVAPFLEARMAGQAETVRRGTTRDLVSVGDDGNGIGSTTN